MRTYKICIEASQRKKLADTIADYYHTKAEYKMPGFRYIIDDRVTVAKDGTVEISPSIDDDSVKDLLKVLSSQGFRSKEQKSKPETVLISFTSPKDDGATCYNIECFVHAYQAIMKKVFKTSSFPVVEKDGKINFPWFTSDIDPAVLKAYMVFISKLTEFAKTRHRLSSMPVSTENEKCTWRTALVRIGLVGEKYKDVRQILTQDVEGNSSFRHGPKRGVAKHIHIAE